LIFLVSWLGPVINWAWERSFRWVEVRTGLLGYAGVLGMVLLFGGLRLAFGQVQPGTVRIHGISPDYQAFVEEPGVEPTLEAIRSHMQRVNEVYLEAVVKEARRGAQIVMWNEMGVGGVEEDANAFLTRAQEVARQEGVYLVMGVGIDFPGEDRQRENRLVVAAPTGEIVINQLKVGATIVDGVKKGDGVLQTVGTRYGKLSGVICWDSDFPMYVRQAGGKQADILFIVNGEPLASLAQMRAQQAIFRAIENGVSLARHDHNLGYSIATDPYGRILASTNVHTASEKVMVAQVPTHHVFTLYSVVGDLFGWLSVAGFVLVAGWAIFRRQTTAKNDAGRTFSESPSA
jgi:apolipoprotein N-acyltransferase